MWKYAGWPVLRTDLEVIGSPVADESGHARGVTTPGVKQQRLNPINVPGPLVSREFATALLRRGEEYFACKQLRPEMRGERKLYRQCRIGPRSGTLGYLPGPAFRESPLRTSTAPKFSQEP